MKRIRTPLAAVLLIAALSSLLISPAYAAYPDAEDIRHTEAVDSLTSLGLFAGYDDGTFRPDAIITRAQMSKLICLAFTGGKEPAAGNEAKAPFSDTAGHWAEVYITYCYRLGVISGDQGAGGPFRPDDTVKAVEAAKMILISLGYSANLSGFTGSSWALHTAMAANQKNLFEALSGLALDAGLTRDNAAQMFYNALEAPIVEYRTVLVTVDGKLVSVHKTADTSETILSKYFGAAKYVGVIIANEFSSAVGGASTLQKPGVTGLDTDGDRDIDLSFKLVTGSAQLGRRVILYAKNYEGGIFQTVFGAPVLSASNVTATYVSAFDSARDLERALKTSGIERLEAAVVSNCVLSGTVSSWSDLHAMTGNGVEVSVVSSGTNDGTADYILITRKSVGKVVGYSAFGEGTLVVQNTSTGALDIAGLTFEEATGAESVRKGDIVLYYAVGSRYFVERASSKQMAIDRIGFDFVGSGGKNYKSSALVTVYNADGDASLPAAVAFETDYTFYFDNAGFIVYLEKSAESARYLMFLAVGTHSPLEDTLPAKVLLDSGSASIVNIDSLTVSGTTLSVEENGADVEAALRAAAITARDADASKPKIYSYTLTSAGSYRVTELPTGYGTTKVVNKSPAFLNSGTVADANTRFVLEYDGTFRPFKGISEVPTVNTAGDEAYCFTYENGGLAAVAFLKGAVSGLEGNDVYILRTSPTVTYESGRHVYRYPALLNGAVTEIEVTGNAKSDAFSRTGLVTNVPFTLDGTWKIDSRITPAAPAAASQLGSGLILGPVMQASAGSTAFSEEYLSCSDATKVYIIRGESVTQGSLDNIVALAGHPSLSSRILITRASLLPDSPEYHAAGSIYMLI